MIKDIIIKEYSFYLSAKYLFLLIFTMNIVSSCLSYVTGYYGGDLEGVEYVVNSKTLGLYTSYTFLLLLMTYFLSMFFSHFKIKRMRLKIKDDTFLYMFFLIITIISGALIVFGNVGTIHRGVVTNRSADLIFTLFNSYFLVLFFLYYMFLSSNRDTYRNFIFYFVFVSYVLMVLNSGFTGYLMYILPIIIHAIVVKFGRRFSYFTLLLSVIMLPFVRIFKWLIVEGGEKFNSEIIDLDFFIDISKVTIDRFSFTPNMIYINENLVSNSDILNSQYLPFFQGYPGSFLHKMLFGLPVENINLYLHQSMQNTNSDSNSTFPLMSYFTIDIF